MTDLSAASLLAMVIGVVWTVLLGFIAKFLYDLANSVKSLGEKMAIVFTKLDFHERIMTDGHETSADLEMRVRILERSLPMGHADA